ncbi:DUF2207 domain-containing protein [Lactobacillus sp. ESL0731]|uniref:DUF2207 domain-containing protein n=1 Tax=unclassified Lactobacillus TaxID=2620435 RepID=UPI0023F78CF5|nr:MULTISPECIES: DUF2207 domain-containing protein [unclassified Lactobacillus]WEV50504.1 DUF2207 domain-containing protein [Lactobacillus sp. ESL0700]WEV61634.1 DUF2207 domain-containing protein [Lactobacillus sp. ESL0731]
MKRKLVRLFVLLSVVLLGLTVSQNVHADDEYDIEYVNVTAKVNADGSLTMTRQIRYDFNDDMHGVYYQQNLGKKQAVKDVSVTVKDNNEPEQTVRDFSIEHNDEGYRFKVYHAVSEDDRLTVTYHYQITNAVTNYRDTAELNFMIIGNGWDTDLDHVQASVIFPGKVKKLRAWAHGPLNGEIKVLPNQGKIVMHVEDLDGDTGVEVHTIFPLTVTPLNKNVIDKNHRQAVIKQEAALAAKANQERKRDRIINAVMIAVALLTGIGAILQGIFVKKQGTKPAKMSQLRHNYSLPAVTPIAAQILDSGRKPDSRAFTAYLMQLAVQKKVKLDDYLVHHKVYYRITLQDPEILTASPLLQFLFNDLGDGQSFTTRELRQYHSKKLGNKFDDWADAQFTGLEDQGYLESDLYDKRSFTLGSILFLLAISFILVLFSWGIFGQYKMQLAIGETIIILLGIAAYFRAKNQISLYTKEGAREAEQVRGFKKMLSDIGNFKMRAVGDLILWEDILPYAVAFDLADKVVKQLKIEFSKEEFANDGFYYYAPFYLSGKNSFAASFNSSFTSGISSGSSSTGASGGFSGGSSGGFGGGSGGGAF